MSKSDIDPFKPGSPLEQALHSLSDAMVGSHGPAPGHKLRPGGRTASLSHRARCGAQWPSRQRIPGSGATPGGRGPACENAHGPAPAPSPRGGGSLPSRSARLVRPRRPGSTGRNRNNRKGIASHASVNRDRGHL